VEKGVDLINNLLHFSKRGGSFQSGDLDIADVIDRTVQIIEKVFNRSIIIRKRVETGLYVKGNQSLLSQVLMNLFTNARDAMPDGGLLKIDAKRGGNKIEVLVSDTGHGMDKDTVKKIFDPFFTLKDVGKGTGLGLSTSHGIVEQHHGTIRVSSTPGKGTIFSLRFPYVIPKQVESDGEAKSVVYGEGQKILIVDDERNVLDSLASLADRLGYQAIPLAKSTDALRSYKEHAPELVIMDRNMPEMDGIACIRQILQADSTAKIVIVSGYEQSGPDGIDQTVRDSIKGYLTKPCGIEDLSQMISKALNK
jgi:CheY-like chemotaxis protein